MSANYVNHFFNF